MRALSLVLLALFAVSSASLASPQDATGGSTTDTGPNGAKEGCYKDGNGRVNMNAAGKTTGDVDVTVTDQDGNSDSGIGTAAGDGGVWESEEMNVGGETYRVSKGKMQHRKGDGSWQNMNKVADKQCEDSTAAPGAPGRGGDGTIGTLPDDPWTAGYSYVPPFDARLQQLGRPVDPVDEMIPA